MIVISSAELQQNTKKYLDIAKNETVVIQRGKAETFVLQAEKHLAPDDDLTRAITAEELLVGIEADIREIFKKKGK